MRGVRDGSRYGPACREGNVVCEREWAIRRPRRTHANDVNCAAANRDEEDQLQLSTDVMRRVAASDVRERSSESTERSRGAVDSTARPRERQTRRRAGAAAASGRQLALATWSAPRHSRGVCSPRIVSFDWSDAHVGSTLRHSPWTRCRR